MLAEKGARYCSFPTNFWEPMSRPVFRSHVTLVEYIPGPPNRWFLVVFGYLKASRNHLLGGTGSCFFGHHMLHLVFLVI